MRLSKTVEEALCIDKEHGNRKWQEDALDKDMNNVRIVFKMINEDAATPVTHTPYEDSYYLRRQEDEQLCKRCDESVR